jgi:hypothetical protein
MAGHLKTMKKQKVMQRKVRNSLQLQPWLVEERGNKSHEDRVIQANLVATDRKI